MLKNTAVITSRFIHHTGNVRPSHLHCIVGYTSCIVVVVVGHLLMPAVSLSSLVDVHTEMCCRLSIKDTLGFA